MEQIRGTEHISNTDSAEPAACVRPDSTEPESPGTEKARGTGPGESGESDVGQTDSERLRVIGGHTDSERLKAIGGQTDSERLRVIGGQTDPERLRVIGRYTDSDHMRAGRGHTRQRQQEAEPRKYPVNGLRICIDRYSNDLEGRIYSKMSKDELPFRNMGELLLRADALFDERGYPQNFQEKRSFAEHTAWDGHYEPPKVFREDAEILNQSGEFCTLDILVNSRRRASWQGLLMNKGKPGSSFQSAKELLDLIMEEINEKSEKNS